MTITFEYVITVLLALVSSLAGIIIYFLKQAKENLESEFKNINLRVGKVESIINDKFSEMNLLLDKKNQFMVDKLLNIAPERGSVNNSIILIEGKIRSSLDRLEACEKKVSEILVSNKQSEVGHNKDIKILHNALMIFKNDLAKIVGQKKDN